MIKYLPHLDACVVTYLVFIKPDAHVPHLMYKKFGLKRAKMLANLQYLLEKCAPANNNNSNDAKRKNSNNTNSSGNSVGSLSNSNNFSDYNNNNNDDDDDDFDDNDFDKKQKSWQIESQLN